jgi:hypothetical protein
MKDRWPRRGSSQGAGGLPGPAAGGGSERRAPGDQRARPSSPPAPCSGLWARPAGRARRTGVKTPPRPQCSKKETAEAGRGGRAEAARPGLRGGRPLSSSAVSRPCRTAFGLRNRAVSSEVPGGLTLSFHLLGPPHTPRRCLRPRTCPGEPRCWVWSEEPGGTALGAGRAAARSPSRVGGRARSAAQSGGAQAARLPPGGHGPHCRLSFHCGPDSGTNRGGAMGVARGRVWTRGGARHNPEVLDPTSVEQRLWSGVLAL